MPSQQCNHIKLNGTACRSMALDGRKFCYFHARMRHATQAKMNSALPRLLLLEDETSIQGALMQIIDMLLADQIEYKKARLILDAIRIASRNVKHIKPEIPAFKPASFISVNQPDEGLDTEAENQQEDPERSDDGNISPLPPSIFANPEAAATTPVAAASAGPEARDDSRDRPATTSASDSTPAVVSPAAAAPGRKPPASATAPPEKEDANPATRANSA
jgi:hypothetical protein